MTYEEIEAAYPGMVNEMIKHPGVGLILVHTDDGPIVIGEEGQKNLYEIRVEVESNIYRIFCCFDEGNLVILFNAFHKKTQKTPSNEIERALRIKQEYFAAKENELKE